MSTHLTEKLDDPKKRKGAFIGECFLALSFEVFLTPRGFLDIDYKAESRLFTTLQTLVVMICPCEKRY
jgi:hypothetical protein